MGINLDIYYDINARELEEYRSVVEFLSNSVLSFTGECQDYLALVTSANVDQINSL